MIKERIVFHIQKLKDQGYSYRQIFFGRFGSARMRFEMNKTKNR